MSTASPLTRHWVATASCIVAMLSVCCVALLAQSPAMDPAWAFFISVPLALAGLVLGTVGLFAYRRYAESLVGVFLSGSVILFWSLMLLRAILLAQIALP